VRRDVTEHLIRAHALAPDGLMPWLRWTIGTLFLLLNAIMFLLLTLYIGDKHVSYRKQLVPGPTYSGIKEIDVGTKLKYAPYWMFFAFPIIDQFLYFMFSVARSFNVPW
jgi:hypothetical protein